MSDHAGQWKIPLRYPLIGIVGPTASGKSDVAQEIASKLNGCVLSCDSMQIYRGMDIGTGKVPKSQRCVQHFGLDLVDPGNAYSVAQYQHYARHIIMHIDAENRRCVVCGGTGFWFRSVIDDYSYDNRYPQNSTLRQKLHDYADTNGKQSLWEKLLDIDAPSAHLIAPNDTKRVIRAFELHDEGSSYARLHAHMQHISQVMPCYIFGLRVDPERLRARIDQRIDAMFDNGFIDEVQRLCEQGFMQGLTAPYAIGYRDVVLALQGKISMDDARTRMKTETHRYAKRQRTWFRRDARIMWLDANSYETDALVYQCLSKIDKMEEIRLKGDKVQE